MVRHDHGARSSRAVPPNKADRTRLRRLDRTLTKLKWTIEYHEKLGNLVKYYQDRWARLDESRRKLRMKMKGYDV